MHCDDAPCIRSADDGAITKREDGIVLIHPEKARGRKEIAAACPYGAIWWNEELDLPQKCTLCAHLLDEGWPQPRCVQACPTGALRIIHRTDDDMAAIAVSQDLEVLSPELNTRPRVYYRNLYRFNRCFISGSVARVENGLVECVENARVTLIREAARIDEAMTDAFGDFKFDRLEENSGRYHLEITYEGTAARLLEVDVSTSVSMEMILLEPAA
jgi:ferredoxin